MGGTGAGTKSRRALVVPFLWVWAGALVKRLVYGALGRTPQELELLKIALSVGYMFIFAWLDALTGGASYELLTLTAPGTSLGAYLFAAFCCFPAQMLGSVAGMWRLPTDRPRPSP